MDQYDLEISSLSIALLQAFAMAGALRRMQNTKLSAAWEQWQAQRRFLYL